MLALHLVYMVLNGISTASAMIELDTKIYALVREAVLKKLGKEHDKFIDDLNI